MVVGFGVFLVYEVRVVGAHQLDAVFLGQLHQHLVGFLLQGESLPVGPYRRVFHFMSLKLQIVVVAEQILVPLHGLPCSLHVAFENLGRHFAGYAGRARYHVFMVSLKVFAVCPRSAVEAVHPGVRHELDKVLVAVVVLGQQYEVVAAQVAAFLRLVLLLVVGHIHLASEYRLERLQPLGLAFAVHLVAVVEQLLHAEHIAVVGDGHALHSVGYGLVNQLGNARLTVEYRIIGMYVKVYEVLHNIAC